MAIAVLDNFHFDLSLVSSEAELGVKGHSTAADGETAEQSAKVKAGSAEQAVEDVAEGGEALEMAEEEEVGSDGDSNTALCEEAKRRALARKIYHSIVKTTLPSLQQVLTKKVTVATQSFILLPPVPPSRSLLPELNLSTGHAANHFMI